MSVKQSLQAAALRESLRYVRRNPEENFARLLGLIRPFARLPWHRCGELGGYRRLHLALLRCCSASAAGALGRALHQAARSLLGSRRTTIGVRPDDLGDGSF